MYKGPEPNVFINTRAMAKGLKGSLFTVSNLTTERKRNYKVVFDIANVRLQHESSLIMKSIESKCNKLTL